MNPPDTAQDGFSNPPLGLLYLAGTLLAHGFEVKVVDGCLDGSAGIRAVLEAFRPDIVGITCLTPGRKKALEAARMAKEIDPSVHTIMGGAHPTIMYRQLLEHYPFVDTVVRGEGERTLLEIAEGRDLASIDGIAYRSDSEIILNPPRKHIADLDEIPFPAWHLADLSRYQARGEGTFNGIDLSRETRVSVIFSRGCVGHCDFCSTWWIWRGWRHRSPKNMADELELLHTRYGIRHFCFADDALTIDRQATIELCEEIIRRSLKIAFFATTRTDCVDEEMLLKLKQAGCYEISFGIETGSPTLLARMNKENDVRNSECAIALSKKAGLKVTALLIVGNIGETEETVHQTVAFLRRTRPHTIGCVGGLWILPGTRVYRESRKLGFIDDDFWLGDEPYKIYTLEHTYEDLERYRAVILGYHIDAWQKTKETARRIGRFLKNPARTLRRRLGCVRTAHQ
ncbi:MAG: radical SAM protein [Thermodesulfovibrionales bacterium]